MKRTPSLFLTALLLAGTGLAACGDETIRITTTSNDSTKKGVLKVVQTLQCPQTLGSLTRKGTAQAEGTVCTYVGPRGADVTLHLQPLDGTSVDDVLRAFEDRLSAEMPGVQAALEASARETDGNAQSEGDTASEATPTSGDTARVDMPGLSIDADDAGASIRIGGMTIDAKDDGASGSANINIDGGTEGEAVSVQAGAQGSQVRTRSGGTATRRSWILTEDGSRGSTWRMVGYEARGPAGGPLVIAVVRARDTEEDPVFDDARALLALNVGE